MVKTENKRFYVAVNDLVDTCIKLESKGYLQLPYAGNQLTKIVIDKERKQFWLVDQPCFENNAKIITRHHKDKIHVLETEDLEEL